MLTYFQIKLINRCTLVVLQFAQCGVEINELLNTFIQYINSETINHTYLV